MTDSNRYIQKYITKTIKGRRTRVGIVLATLEDGKIKYGWSLARTVPTKKDLELGVDGLSRIDKFDEGRGMEIALERLNAKAAGSLPEMPGSVRSVLRDRTFMVKETVDGKTRRVMKTRRGFETRAKKYFKV